jgi:sugar lactone lactonase YvrE
MVAGLGALLSSAISSAAPADLFVPQTEAGVILKFSPDGTKSIFASELDHPGGLAFDRAGNLFVSVGPGQFRDITKITPSGEMTVFATGLSIPGGLAFDGAGNLYVTFSTGDTGGIWKFNPDGTKSLFGSYDGLESGSPFGLAFGPLGDLFATIPPGPFDFNGGIIRYSPDGTGSTFFTCKWPRTGLRYGR